MIGNADVSGKNTYSFRQFLHEETSGLGNKKHVYLTHVVIEKSQMQDIAYLSHVSYAMSRFYTLDIGTPETLISFIKEIQSLKSKYLKPLLKERLEHTSGSVEEVINGRMVAYEKQVSVLILQKLPRIQATLHNQVDQDYLFYHLDKLIKQMIESIRDFRLQPLVSNTNSSSLLLIKLIAMRQILKQSYNLVFSQDLSIEERIEMMAIPLLRVKEKVDLAKTS